MEKVRDAKERKKGGDTKQVEERHSVGESSLTITVVHIHTSLVMTSSQTSSKLFSTGCNALRRVLYTSLRQPYLLS